MRYFDAARRCTLIAMGLLVAVAVDARAQQMMMLQGGGRGIEVTGVGEVEVAPDEATLNFAVETSATTSQAAAQENAQIMERVIAALVAAGIPRTEIETRNFAVYPDYANDPDGGEPRVRGYRVMNHVSLETTRLETVGALIDAALAAGANRVEGISFGLSDPAAAEADALREAVERARASAETLASALGVPLGQLMHATTSSNPIRPMPLMMAQEVRLEGVQAFDTPIQPGQQTVQARVVLVYSIGN